MKTPKPDQLVPWASQYSESSFWGKLAHRTKQLGRRPAELGLVLFYTLREPGTPTWCKAVISGSLGYFISLIDAVPDLTPVLGYTDDISVMIASIAILGAHVTPDIRRRAHHRADTIFGTQSTATTSDNTA
ncbi:YkvA family protein [Marinobacter sp. 1Y8]